MIIQELNLIGFGKFENKIIKLNDGINIIYGENEFGKTTIHNFIDGMFYGFLKPYVKNTSYLDEHAKYIPWKNSVYSGIIKFQHLGELYSIERNFTKSRESTLVILEKTGEDITYSIDNGDKGRILQPGIHFFGFNNAVFSNTVLIKQLALKTDEKLANELRDKLVNIATTMDESISIEQAIMELNKELKSIGSLKAPTSEYSLKQNNLTNLRNEKNEILLLKKEYEGLLDANILVDEKIDSYNLKIKEFESRIKFSKIIEKYNQFKEAKELANQLLELSVKIEKYKIYNQLSMEDYSDCISMSNDIIHYENRMDELKEVIDKLDIEIDILSKNNKDNALRLDENIAIDYNYYEELEDENFKLKNSNNINELELVKMDFQTSKKNKNSIKKLLGVCGVLFIGILIYSFLKSEPKYLFFNIFIIVVIILSVIKKRKINSLLKEIESQIFILESIDEEHKIKIKDNESLLNNILEKYSIENKFKFRKLQENIELKIYKKKDLEEELNKNVEKSIKLQEELANNENKRRQHKIRLEDLLYKNKSNSIDEFKKGLSNKQIYEDLSSQAKNTKDLYTRILGNSKLEDILIELENFGDYSNVLESLSREELNNYLDNIKDELVVQQLNKRGFTSKIEELSPRVSNLVNVDEEITRIMSQIENMDKKIDAIQLAKETIEALSKDIHIQFAPTINKRVSSVIEQITDGKYNSVKIDNNLEIGINDPITGQIININSLSGGTIDQLYFALRFSIIKSMVDHSLPLILDDSFIQYDDIRLENILRFLNKISIDRQIILFTCQKREQNLLDKINAKYSIIEL